jgi:hypothetical protein
MRRPSVSWLSAYSVLVVDRERRIYGEIRGGHCRLLRIAITPMKRVAREIQAQVHRLFNLQIVVLEITPPVSNQSSCVIAYLVSGSPAVSALTQISIDQIADVDLSEEQRKIVTNLLCDRTAEPICRLGWFEDAVRWIESVLGIPLVSQEPILQMNAGNGFMLLRVTAIDDRRYWLKATREPNKHELSVTKFLCSMASTRDLVPRPLPRLYGVREDWNAWLLSGEGEPLGFVPTTLQPLYCRLKEAVSAMARLQLMSVDNEIRLLKHGAFDHRLVTWTLHAEPICDSLKELSLSQACGRQDGSGRLATEELTDIYGRVLNVISDLGIPSSLLHGDLNWGNVLFADGCRFIDWSEARVGCPLVSLWHLLMLIPGGYEACQRYLRQTLFEDYCQVWSDSGTDPSAFKRAFRYAPLLAAFSALYARGDWFHSENPTLPPAVERILCHLHREASILQQEGGV